jgi:hypothetical protein
MPNRFIGSVSISRARLLHDSLTMEAIGNPKTNPNEKAKNGIDDGRVYEKDYRECPRIRFEKDNLKPLFPPSSRPGIFYIGSR